MKEKERNIEILKERKTKLTSPQLPGNAPTALTILTIPEIIREAKQPKDTAEGHTFGKL